MLPERLDFLSRFEEFYMLLSTQCKAKSKILHYQKRV